VQIDEESVSRLPELANRHLGAEDAAVFLATVARSVLLRVAGAADPAGVGSRLGGLPSMPARPGWPTIGPDTWFDRRLDEGTPLRFLGQVNTSEVNPLLADQTLPPDTVLGFFFEASPGSAPLQWTDMWEAAAHQVVVVRVDEAGPMEPPGDAASPAHALRPEAVTTVPPVEYFTLGLWRHDDWRAAARRRSALEALYAELRPVPVEHPVRMFGWFDGQPRGWSWAGAASDDPLRLLLHVAVDPALGLGWPRTRSLYVFIGTKSLTAGPPYRGIGRYA
jgi:hypothetical protein